MISFQTPDGGLIGDEVGPSSYTQEQADAFQPILELRMKCKLTQVPTPKEAYLTGEYKTDLTVDQVRADISRRRRKKQEVPMVLKVALSMALFPEKE